NLICKLVFRRSQPVFLLGVFVNVARRQQVAAMRSGQFAQRTRKLTLVRTQRVPTLPFDLLMTSKLRRALFIYLEPRGSPAAHTGLGKPIENCILARRSCGEIISEHLS